MRWSIVVELLYEIEEGDTADEHALPGAAEVVRAHGKLSAMMDGKPFIRYCMPRLPRKVYDYD